MIKGPKLKPAQWKLLASASSNIGQAVILFSLAATFFPETVGLQKDFSRLISIAVLLGGLVALLIAVIIAKKEK